MTTLKALCLGILVGLAATTSVAWAKAKKDAGASCSKDEECKSGSCIKNPKGHAGKVCG